jgi:hypothetical protein
VPVLTSAVDRTLVIEVPAAAHMHNDSAFAEEDAKWAAIAKQWLGECRACANIYRYKGGGDLATALQNDEDAQWAPIAHQWAEECRACDKVHRCRGGDDLATALAYTLAFKVQAKRDRRKREKKARNANKHRTADLFRAATQNFNGESGQEKLGELVRNVILVAETARFQSCCFCPGSW